MVIVLLTVIATDEVHRVMVLQDKIVTDHFLNEMVRNDHSVEEAKVVHHQEQDDRLGRLVDVLVDLEPVLSREARDRSFLLASIAWDLGRFGSVQSTLQKRSRYRSFN